MLSNIAVELLKIAVRLIMSQALTMIDAAQIRAARGLLNIGQTELARVASVHVATIRRLEAATEIRGAAETVWKIQKALEAGGVEFIPEEAGRGAGVRLKQARHSRP
jgi:transcriptional regulator with XRE-family HTH domain